MFISKKKHAKELLNAKLDAWSDRASADREDRQWDDIRQLKKDVKKLKKAIKNGW